MAFQQGKFICWKKISKSTQLLLTSLTTSEASFFLFKKRKTKSLFFGWRRRRRRGRRRRSFDHKQEACRVFDLILEMDGLEVPQRFTVILKTDFKLPRLDLTSFLWCIILKKEGQPNKLPKMDRDTLH